MARRPAEEDPTGESTRRPAPGRGAPAEGRPLDLFGTSSAGTSRGRVIGWFWILFWLIFLVPPVLENIRGTTQQRLGAGLLVGGAVAYAVAMRTAIRAMVSGRGQARDLSERTGRTVVGGTTVVVLFLVAAVAVLGGAGFGLLPYAAVILAMGLALPIGIVAAMVLCLVVALASWLTGHGLDTGLLFSAIASAAASAFGAYSIHRNLAARRAEEDAHLLRVQEERNRMARDLHDILGHSLTVITMKAELAARLVDLDPARAKAQIEELEQLSRSALADVRRTVSGYREVSLSGELARARSTLADAGIRADLPGSVDDVPPDLRELFAWVVREATTNIIRHSGARTAAVTISPHRIAVRDDGHGATSGPGNGLSGLAERAAAAGATLTTSSDDGFTVVVEAPTTAGSHP